VNAWLVWFKRKKKEVFVCVIKINKLIDVDSFVWLMMMEVAREEIFIE
jgi:hypothetical protein